MAWILSLPNDSSFRFDFIRSNKTRYDLPCPPHNWDICLFLIFNFISHSCFCDLQNRPAQLSDLKRNNNPVIQNKIMAIRSLGYCHSSSSLVCRSPTWPTNVLCSTLSTCNCDVVSLSKILNPLVAPSSVSSSDETLMAVYRPTHRTDDAHLCSSSRLLC